MTRICFVFITLIFIFSNTSAQEFNSDIEKWVYYISDDDKMGRRNGSEELKIVAEWIKKKYREFNLNPFIGQSYFQEYSYQRRDTINERNIIVVEDIVDSGLSIKFIQEMLANHNPASVKVASLLVKPESLKYNVKIDYIGFEIPDEFVIGYGLDYAQKYRNLNSIYALSE